MRRPERSVDNGLKPSVFLLETELLLLTKMKKSLSNHRTIHDEGRGKLLSPAILYDTLPLYNSLIVSVIAIFLIRAAGDNTESTTAPRIKNTIISNGITGTLHVIYAK